MSPTADPEPPYPPCIFSSAAEKTLYRRLKAVYSKHGATWDQPARAAWPSLVARASLKPTAVKKVMGHPIARTLTDGNLTWAHVVVLRAIFGSRLRTSRKVVDMIRRKFPGAVPGASAYSEGYRNESTGAAADMLDALEEGLGEEGMALPAETEVDRADEAENVEELRDAVDGIQWEASGGAGDVVTAAKQESRMVGPGEVIAASNMADTGIKREAVSPPGSGTPRRVRRVQTWLSQQAQLGRPCVVPGEAPPLLGTRLDEVLNMCAELERQVRETRWMLEDERAARERLEQQVEALKQWSERVRMSYKATRRDIADLRRELRGAMYR